MRDSLLIHTFVDEFPNYFEPSTHYVSIPYATSAHLCCCGCGEKVVTPFGPDKWKLTYDGETVSLVPSIGSWYFACQSHYLIRNDRVKWITNDKFSVGDSPAKQLNAGKNEIKRPTKRKSILQKLRERNWW